MVEVVKVVLMVVLMNVALWLREVWRRRNKTTAGKGLGLFMHPCAFGRRACMFHADLVISHSNALPSSVMVHYGVYGRMTSGPFKAVSGSDHYI